MPGPVSSSKAAPPALSAPASSDAAAASASPFANPAVPRSAPAPAAVEDSFEAESLPATFTPQHRPVPINALDAAMQPALVSMALGDPIYMDVEEIDVLDALAALKKETAEGSVDLNHPITAGRYSGYRPIAVAAREANAGLVSLFLRYPSVNPCARDTRKRDTYYHRTVLMHAVRGAIENKSLHALEVLLKDKRVLMTINETAPSRADPDIRLTALDMALQAGYQGRTFASAVVQLLLAHGAKVTPIVTESSPG